MTLAEFQNEVLPLKNKLYHFAYRLLSNAEDARDTVQEVMMKVWESGKPIAEYENVEAWCMTLTRNRSLDRIKVEKSRSAKLKRIDHVTSHTRTPGELMEWKETMKIVLKITQELPTVQRELIELRDFQEKSYEEIAMITGLEMTQVKVYLHRARKVIRESLNTANHYGLERK